LENSMNNLTIVIPNAVKRAGVFISPRVGVRDLAF